ncbi:hypothetical protein [Flavobacterium sp.]|jgi:hypothetical protein|uniref:hypothetical protein n=1 Tax=Flavobacterium sp. TaxID=239 RepID=UPI00261AC517|nr:hypothetical protein [Flavobacterium sp.]
MKKFICTIVTLFSLSIIYSQDFDYFKKKDTIYIEFKGNKNEKKYSIQTRIKPINFDEKSYEFVVPNRWRFVFYHTKYKNWDKQEAGIVSEVREVGKMFLKEHKRTIIGISFFRKHESEDIVCEILTQFKVLYVIDFTEKKKGEFKMYEVSSINVCPVSE